MVKTCRDARALHPDTAQEDAPTMDEEEEEEDEEEDDDDDEGFAGKPMDGHASAKCLANVSSIFPPYPTFSDVLHSGQKKAMLSLRFPTAQLWFS